MTTWADIVKDLKDELRRLEAEVAKVREQIAKAQAKADAGEPWVEE